MLRMQGFRVVHAGTPEQAVALYRDSDSPAYIAGGTDLLPTMKLELREHRTLIAVGRALSTSVQEEGDDLVLGAGMTLAQVAGLHLAPLSQAAGHVASPQIRNSGTLGGNVMLDTRCRFYNQSPAWRASLGGCLRAEGPSCRVTDSKTSCVATQCSDTVPALMVLDARLRLLSPAGQREVPLTDLLRYDGMKAIDLEPGELLTHVVVPRPGAGTVAEAEKLTARGSIDFPMLSIAALARFEPSGALAALRIAVGAVSPQPRLVSKLDAFLGRPLDDAAIEAIGQQTWQRTRPMGSLAGDPAWRRDVSAVTVGRMLRRLREAPR